MFTHSREHWRESQNHQLEGRKGLHCLVMEDRMFIASVSLMIELFRLTTKTFTKQVLCRAIRIGTRNIFLWFFFSITQIKCQVLMKMYYIFFPFIPCLGYSLVYFWNLPYSPDYGKGSKSLLIWRYLLAVFFFGW